MNVAITLAAGALTAWAMEHWAAFVHERAWHGPIWSWHAPHHRPGRGINKNDVLSTFHAPPAAAMVVYGLHFWGTPLAALSLGVGGGMTLFGIGYVIVHDGFVHGRMPLGFLRRLPGFERIRREHLRHHAHGGAPFGLFLPRS